MDKEIVSEKDMTASVKAYKDASPANQDRLYSHFDFITDNVGDVADALTEMAKEPAAGPAVQKMAQATEILARAVETYERSIEKARKADLGQGKFDKTIKARNVGGEIVEVPPSESDAGFRAAQDARKRKENKGPAGRS